MTACRAVTAAALLFASLSVFAADATDLVRKALIADQAFGPTTERCLRYTNEGEDRSWSQGVFVIVAVRAVCGGGDTAGLVGRFLVDQKTGDLYWFDHADYKLVPYNSWLRTSR